MNRKISKLLFDLLFAVAIILLLIKIYLRQTNKTESAELVGYICLALFIAALMVRFGMKFFPKSFNKPTREEIDLKVHGDKNWK